MWAEAVFAECLLSPKPQEVCPSFSITSSGVNGQLLERGDVEILAQGWWLVTMLYSILWSPSGRDEEKASWKKMFQQRWLQAGVPGLLQAVE